MAVRRVTGPDGSIIEYPVPGMDTAIGILRPGVSWELTNNKFTVWDDPEGREPPTGEEITAEVKREEKVWWHYEYERKREKQYPLLAEQLDMLFHDIENGNLENGTWIKSIRRIKEEFPKPINNILFLTYT